MPQPPTQWTPTNNEPANFTPYGSNNPTILTANDGGAPTNWSNADTKNPATYTPSGKNPTAFNSTFGITNLTYDTLGATYDDATVTYDQTQQNQTTPVNLATTWSASDA